MTDASSSTHYVDLFASFTSSIANGYSTVMLRFTPMESETSLDADEHNNISKFVLRVNGK